MKKRIINLFVYFILGYILFNIIVSLTKVIILTLNGLTQNIFNVLINEFKSNWLIYIILYFLLIVGIYIYDKTVVKKLNNKLEKIKERRK